MTKQTLLPGMESYEEEEYDEFHEGQPKANGKYFDAALLPDIPSYQRNALNNQTYVLYVIFPTWESLKDGVNVLTGGERNSLASSAKMATISSQSKNKKFGLSLIEFWRMKIMGVLNELAEPEDVVSQDDAQEPI